MEKRLTLTRILGALMIAGIAGTAIGQEDTAPSKLASNVRDNAGLFTASTVERVNAQLERLERTAEVPAVIETRDSLERQPLDVVARREQERVNPRGLLVLVTKQERKIEVVVPKELQEVVPESRRKAIKDAFIEGFRRRDFDEGLNHGIEEIAKALATAKPKSGNPYVTRIFGNAGAGKPRPPLVVREQVRLTLEGARRIIAGAEAEAEAMKLKVNIAVVDDGGHLLSFARMDGARPASGYTATTKAVTAATFRQSTGPLPPGTTAPDPLLNLSLQNAAAVSGGKITTLNGGIPVIVEGQVIGGVGVGGGSGEQDATVARAGVDTFLADLQSETPTAKEEKKDEEVDSRR